jgi:hypothetical protein
MTSPIWMPTTLNGAKVYYHVHLLAFVSLVAHIAMLHLPCLHDFTNLDANNSKWIKSPLPCSSLDFCVTCSTHCNIVTPLSALFLIALNWAIFPSEPTHCFATERMIYDIVLHTWKIDLDVNPSFKTLQNSSIMMLGEKEFFFFTNYFLIGCCPQLHFNYRIIFISKKINVNN